MSEPNENDLPYSDAVRMAGLIHKTLEKDPLTGEEQQELEAWLGSSESHAKLFESLGNRPQVAGELEALLQYDEEKAVTAVFTALGRKPPSAIQKWKDIGRRLSVAASLLLLAGAGWWFFARQSDGTPSLAATRPGAYKAILTLTDGRDVLLDSLHTPDLGMQGAARLEQQPGGRLAYTAGGDGPAAYNTLTTPRGGQYSLKLADGSEVWLNAGSSITYPTSFTGNTREVTVNGEAYFSVAKDKTKPFFVTARAMKVQVVGTTFNVMAYGDEDTVRTTLVEGIVKASRTDAKAQADEMVLQPGEQAALASRSGALRREKPDLEEVTAWRNEQFYFNETDMGAIMRQIARWYDVDVEYRGPVANIGFSGQIAKKKSLEELLAILSDTHSVHFEIKDDKTIVVIPGPK